MSRLKGSSYFCEDLRMEMSGQPMLIGLLSPAFEVDGPVTFPNLNFVSLFYIGPEDEEKNLELTFEFESCTGSASESVGPFNRSLAHDDSTGDVENLAVISYPLTGIEVDVGSKITAILKYEGSEEKFSVEFRAIGQPS